MIKAVEELKKETGVLEACRVLGVPRSSIYRARKPKKSPKACPAPARALKSKEKVEVRSILNSERFCDSAPRQVYATLLDEGRYLCNWRTMYRILGEHNEVRERRQQRPARRKVKPELRATKPNQVWTWDITMLKGPGCFYYLYTIIDIFSRYIVGWIIAKCESAELAEKLIAETIVKQKVKKEQLTLHADRGSAMRSKTVKALLKKLGVTKSHSRPYTPTDNPYSEAHFKTMKYRPDYPKAFSGIEEAHKWTKAFVQWYNNEHYHSGLALLAPASVHYGEAECIQARRQQVLDAAYEEHPERFVNGKPTMPEIPSEVWINRPQHHHKDTNFSAEAAASDREAGAQDRSRAKSVASLDLHKPLPILESALTRAESKNIIIP